MNGVDKGHGVGVRVPSANAVRFFSLTKQSSPRLKVPQPITDITSPNIICNTNYVQPVSQTVISVPAGGQVTAQFHHTSAGFVGGDPADPLDPTNKGRALLSV